MHFFKFNIAEVITRFKSRNEFQIYLYIIGAILSFLISAIIIMVNVIIYQYVLHSNITISVLLYKMIEIAQYNFFIIGLFITLLNFIQKPNLIMVIINIINIVLSLLILGIDVNVVVLQYILLVFNILFSFLIFYNFDMRKEVE